MEVTRSSTQPSDYLNPPLVFQELSCGSKKFFVIRDDFLPAGTKGRAMVDYMRNSSATDFIYAGPVTGYAQVVLAYAASLCSKRAHIFVEKFEPRSSLTQRAIDNGGNVVEVPRPVWLARLQDMARAFAAELQARQGADSVHLFELGFHEDAYIQLLADKIRAAAPQSLISRPPARLWLTCGSATVLRAIARVFPSTHFMVVQVGRNIWADLLAGLTYTKFIAPEKFYQATSALPPYPSVATYDAKLWRFVEEHGADGDFIWNVGCDTPTPVSTLNSSTVT